MFSICNALWHKNKSGITNHVRNQTETIRLQYVLKSEIKVVKTVHHLQLKKKSPTVAIEQVSFSDSTHNKIREEILHLERLL